MRLITAGFFSAPLTAPRVTPADVEAAIASEHYFTALKRWLALPVDQSGKQRRRSLIC